MDNLHWSEWITYERNNDADVPDGIPYGVYRNRLVDASGKPIPIIHPLGIDNKGIMYIGSAGVRSIDDQLALRKRFNVHRRAHLSGVEGRAKDTNLIRLWRSIWAKYPKAVMQFQYLVCGSSTEAAIIEEKLLNEFIIRFGERPRHLWEKENNSPKRF